MLLDSDWLKWPLKICLFIKWPLGLKWADGPGPSREERLYADSSFFIADYLISLGYKLYYIIEFIIPYNKF